jgi:hypothetical protein
MTQEWLIKNVKGNMDGSCYRNFLSWLLCYMAALAEHPQSKRFAQLRNNWFWARLDHNGAFFLIDGFSFYTFFGDPCRATRFNRA